MDMYVRSIVNLPIFLTVNLPFGLHHTVCMAMIYMYRIPYGPSRKLPTGKSNRVVVAIVILQGVLID